MTIRMSVDEVGTVIQYRMEHFLGNIRFLCPKPMRYRYRLKESDLSLWGSYRLARKSSLIIRTAIDMAIGDAGPMSLRRN